MSQKILIKRGVKNNLPTLDVGELGFTTDTEQLFIGALSGNKEIVKKIDFDNSLEGVNSNINSINENINITNQNVSNNSLIIKGSNYPIKTIEKLSNKSDITIVCFGDSLTWGAKANEPTPTQVSVPYTQHLQTWLNYFTGSNVTMFNEGNLGFRADQCIDVLQSQVLDNNPDLVCIMLGTNEALQNTSYTTFKNSMETIIETCLKNDIEVVLITPHKIYGTGYIQEICKLNDITRALANHYKVSLIDWEKQCDKIIKSGLTRIVDLLPDGVHLNDSLQYKYIADTIIKELLYTIPLNLEINEKMHIVSNPAVFTDGSVYPNSSTTLFEHCYYMKPEVFGGTSLYIRFSIFNDVPKNYKYYLIGTRQNSGGSCAYTSNGMNMGSLDFYNDTTVNDDEIELNLIPGLNNIEILRSGISLGAGGFGDIIISGIGLKEV